MAHRKRGTRRAGDYFDVRNRDERGIGIIQSRRTHDEAEALAWARETPHSDIEVLDADGWVVERNVYSPKHPPPRPARGNPPLAIVGANPPAGDLLGYVAAVVYYHIDDDNETVRVHLFGDGGRFRGLDDGSVRIWPPDYSDVSMETGRDRQRILLSHRRGLPLVGDF